MQNYRGDVTDLRVVRRVEQQPQSWRVWQPVIIQGHKKRHLIVAFGAMINGKKDMGDILATISTNYGDTWEEPVMVFDHRQRQGMVQFAYANPVLYRAPGQEVIWCFAMRCPIAQKNSEESKPEPDLHNAKSKAFFGRSSNGTHIYVYSDGPPQRVKAPGFPNGGRIALRYKTKISGDTWSEEQTFYDAGIKNSYPTLIEIAPDDFRCVWDSGTPDTPRTHIHFGKLRISP